MTNTWSQRLTAISAWIKNPSRRNNYKASRLALKDQFWPILKLLKVTNLQFIVHVFEIVFFFLSNKSPAFQICSLFSLMQLYDIRRKKKTVTKTKVSLNRPNAMVGGKLFFWLRIHHSFMTVTIQISLRDEFFNSRWRGVRVIAAN